MSIKISMDCDVSLGGPGVDWGCTTCVSCGGPDDSIYTHQGKRYCPDCFCGECEKPVEEVFTWEDDKAQGICACADCLLPYYKEAQDHILFPKGLIEYYIKNNLI